MPPELSLRREVKAIMAKNKNRAFTLIELILVVSVVVILAAVGIVSYNKSRDRAISREAIANLRLIAAAERIYKMEQDQYTGCVCNDAATCAVSATGCNSLLRLALNTKNWTYNVTPAGLSSAVTITAANTPSGISGCTYTLTSADFDTNDYTSKSSGCP
jgi:prepilin-type N-terminal cleavage/methylation domain-containing protein